MPLATNIKFLRNSDEQTQEVWGKKFGLSRANVDNYERGKARPSHEVMIKLSEYYNTSIENLLIKDFSKNPEDIFIKTNNTINKENQAELLKAKEQTIDELKNEVDFLRNQVTTLTNALSKK